MASKTKLKEAFEVDAQYGAFYTGGTVLWTSDGKELLCQNNDKINVIPLSDESTLTKQRSICGMAEVDGGELDLIESDLIYTFALSHTDELVVTSHKSGLIKLWQRVDGVQLKMWKGIHQGPIPQLAFSPCDKVIASGGADSSIRLWDYLHKTCVGTLRGCQGVISVLKFHWDKERQLVFAAADDNKIHCWNYATKDLQFVLSGHFSKITSISIGVDSGDTMVSGSRDKVLILWDLATGKSIRTVPIYEGCEGVIVLPTSNSQFKLPDEIELDPDRVYAVSAGEKGKLKIWDMTGGRMIYEQKTSLITTITENDGLSITHLLLNEENGGQFACVTADHNILVHNASTFYCSKQLIGFSDEILDLVVLGKKGRFLAAATNSRAIKLYDTLTMNCQLLNGHTDIVLSLAAHRNLLLSSAKDSTVRLWELDPGSFTVSCLAIGTKHTASVGSVAFGKAAQTICASVSQDTCLKVWQIPKMPTQRPAEPLNLQCLATQIVHDKDVNCVAISPNDKMIATASQDKTAKLWQANDLTLLGVFRGHKRGIWCVRFSPSDQVLLTTSADCTMKLWSLSDMSCLKTFEGHESSILKSEFITQGMQLLSAGSDGLIKLWNIKTSECTTTLDKHDGRIWAVALSHDEQSFFSGGTDSQLIKWKDVTEEQKLALQLEQQEISLQEQELNNLLASKRLLKALRLALRLGKPMLSLKIITNVIKTQEDGLDETILGLSDEHKTSLLKHASTWNTNSKNCRPAQLVLNIILNDILSGTFVPSSGLEKIIEETLPYTERHFKRMTEYLKDLKFIEFTLKCMQPHVVLDNDDIEMK